MNPDIRRAAITSVARQGEAYRFLERARHGLTDNDQLQFDALLPIFGGDKHSRWSHRKSECQFWFAVACTFSW